MDINKASDLELERASQADGTHARYIVEERSKRRGFASWEEVKQISGSEDKLVENLRAAGMRIGNPGSHTTAHQVERENSKSETGARGGGSGQSRRGRLDINTASAEELENVFSLMGRARYLIQGREGLGGFRSWEQIQSEVPSFDQGMIENMQDAGARLGSK